ncbi:MAG: DUF2721 domain-containing protein [Pseudomonadota bacterium]
MTATSNIVAIQVAVAPVFLLVGIAGLLNMLSIRLGRIIDRKRVIDNRLEDCSRAETVEVCRSELLILHKRIRLVNRAIQFSVASALVICVLVSVLFVAEYIGTDLGNIVAGLFILTMLIIIVALLASLAEVNLAARQAQEEAVSAVGTRDED